MNNTASDQPHPLDTLPDLSFRRGWTPFAQALIVLVILTLTSLVAWFLIATKKHPENTGTAREAPVVRVGLAEAGDFSLRLTSQGLVEPVRQTQILAEVAGKVIWLSPKFKVGETFAADEVLLKLESVDHAAALAGAKSRLAETKLAREQEQVRGDQAKRDWEKLNSGQKPANEMVLRGPQFQVATDTEAAAQAALDKAQRDLERTEIKMPYAGRLSAKRVDLGAFVAPGAPVAECFGTEQFEVRLPLSQADSTLLGDGKGVKLELKSRSGAETYAATLTRQEGNIDRATRSIFWVAALSDAKQAASILPGTFLQATVQTPPVKGLVRIPARCLLDGTRVWILDKENKLASRNLQVARMDEEFAYVTDGLKAGDRIMASVLPVVTEGMAVRDFAEEAKK